MVLATKCLPMWGISDQRLIRGGMGAAHTQVGRAGAYEAFGDLYESFIEAIRIRLLPDGCLTETESLQPEALTRLASARIEGFPELSNPGQDASQIDARAALIRALNAGKNPRLEREAIKMTETEFEHVTGRLKEALENAWNLNPWQVGQRLAAVRRQLNAQTLQDPSPQPAQKFLQLADAVGAVKARRASFAKTTFDFVISQLTQKAGDAYRDARESLAANYVIVTLRQHGRKIVDLLDDLDQRANELREQVDAVRKLLDARRKRVAEDEQFGRASIVLGIPGPSKNETLAGMKTRHAASSTAELAATVLTELLNKKLRDFARRHCPGLDWERASLPRLIHGIEPRHLVDLFLESAEELIGEGHSLFELIERFGVSDCAQILFERAETTCHLGGRANELFDCPPTQLAIVRLPKAIGPRDPEIRESLASAFRALGYVSITDGGKDEGIAVIRLHSGWPIGIEQANEGVLARYLRSGKRRHVPHLIGILDDAPIGEVAASYRHFGNQGKEIE